MGRPSHHYKSPLVCRLPSPPYSRHKINQGLHLQSHQGLNMQFGTWSSAHVFTAALASHSSGPKHPQTPKFLFSKGWRRNRPENRTQTLDFLPRKTCMCPSVTAITSKWITWPFSKAKCYSEKSTYRPKYMLFRGNILKNPPFPHRLLLHNSQWYFRWQRWTPWNGGQGRAFLLNQERMIFPCPLFSTFTVRFLKAGIILTCIDLKFHAECLFTVSVTSVSKPFPINALALEGDSWRWPSTGHCSFLSLLPCSSLHWISLLPTNSIRMI